MHGHVHSAHILCSAFGAHTKLPKVITAAGNGGAATDRGEGRPDKLLEEKRGATPATDGGGAVIIVQVYVCVHACVHL